MCVLSCVHFHVSTVMCLMSCVYCHLSTDMCLLSCVYFHVSTIMFLLSCVYCHVSNVMCVLSFVHCHVSTVMCLLSCFYYHVFTVMCLLSCVYCHVSTVMCLLSCFYGKTWYSPQPLPTAWQCQVSSLPAPALPPAPALQLCYTLECLSTPGARRRPTWVIRKRSSGWRSTTNTNWDHQHVLTWSNDKWYIFRNC